MDGDRAVLMEASGWQILIDALARRDFDVVGPRERDGAIVAAPMAAADQLPVGRGDETAAGRYRLRDRDDRARFGWSLPAQSWKPLLHPAATTTMTMTQPARDGAVAVTLVPRPRRRMAFIGVRPCELAAISRLDEVLRDGPDVADPTYSARRDGAAMIVVDCHAPAATCRCTSFGTGPHLDPDDRGHDLRVTELVDGDGEPSYVVTPASRLGDELVDDVLASGCARRGGREADVDTQRRAAARSIEGRFDTAELPGALRGQHDSALWDEIAQRCVACGNCTAVCPTCFCTTVDDVGDLTGRRFERRRRWESCFSLEFSRLGGETVRSSVASRYRQWMTHKLDTWHDQFGASGCVGCGRCTAWCPLGIDFLAEARGVIDAGHHAVGAEDGRVTDATEHRVGAEVTA